jgi:hypothetical protein
MRRALATFLLAVMSFPLPPRCRGVRLANGGYAGCPYGSGEERVPWAIAIAPSATAPAGRG